MASPIAIAAALSRAVRVTCPYCGHHKTVDRAPKAFRVCPKCHRHYPDPRALKRKRRR